MREKEGILSAEAGVHQHQRDKWSEQQKNYLGEFPCGLVVRIPGFHCCDAGSIPGGGTEIQQKKKKNYFQTRSQRESRRIRRKCHMGIQDQRMSGHWQEGQMR